MIGLISESLLRVAGRIASAQVCHTSEVWHTCLFLRHKAMMGVADWEKRGGKDIHIFRGGVKENHKGRRTKFFIFVTIQIEMNPDHLELLKKKLVEEYVPNLPALLAPKSQDENSKKNLSRAYAAFAIAKILRLDAATASNSVVDDYDDNGIDVIFYHQNSRKLYLLQGKLKANETFKHEDATNFIVGIRDLCNQRFVRFNQNIQNRRDEIEAALEDADEIVLVVAHISAQITLHALREFDHFLQEEGRDLDQRLRLEIDDFGENRALEGLLGEKAVPIVNARIFITGDKEMSGTPRTWYGQISVKELVNLYESHGNALFEKNIRYFLGIAKSDVNKAIGTTLNTVPENFFFFNNGITALAKSVSPKGRLNNRRSFSVKGLSIINGAQTIASSHYFAKTSPEKDFAQAKVMITLIEVDNDEYLSQNITRARNHQNAVDNRHFAALDPEQERIRRELALMNLNYRYRPEAGGNHEQDVFSAEEAAVALALFSNVPHTPILLKQSAGTFTDPRSETVNERAAAGTEKIIFRHSRYVVMWLLFNSNRNWITGALISNDNDAANLISRGVDMWRERVRAATVRELGIVHKGPLAFFRNQTVAVPFVIRLRDEGLAPAAVANARTTNEQ
jgi:hypothetical protein